MCHYLKFMSNWTVIDSLSLASSRQQTNKLKSLKVAKSKDDDGWLVDGSVDAGDVNGVLMLFVMMHVMLCVIVCVMVCVMVSVMVSVIVCYGVCDGVCDGDGVSGCG